MLSLREKRSPNDWWNFYARSAFGGFLLTQRKYTKAEPLLLSGYEGMKQREEKIPPESKSRLKEAIRFIVELNEATDRRERATEWKKKLGEFDNAHSGSKEQIK
jgi:hypothetical protein